MTPKDVVTVLWFALNSVVEPAFIEVKAGKSNLCRTDAAGSDTRTADVLHWPAADSVETTYLGVHETGCSSPDLNPIEQVIAELKHLPGKAAAQIKEALTHRIGSLIDNLPRRIAKTASETQDTFPSRIFAL